MPQNPVRLCHDASHKWANDPIFMSPVAMKTKESSKLPFLVSQILCAGKTFATHAL